MYVISGAAEGCDLLLFLAGNFIASTDQKQKIAAFGCSGEM